MKILDHDLDDLRASTTVDDDDDDDDDDKGGRRETHRQFNCYCGGALILWRCTEASACPHSLLL